MLILLPLMICGSPRSVMMLSLPCVPVACGDSLIFFLVGSHGRNGAF